jgi:hypothetical protein
MQIALINIIGIIDEYINILTYILIKLSNEIILSVFYDIVPIYL